MDSSLSCSECGKAYTRRNLLIRHMKTSHGIVEIKPRGQLKCTSCSEKFVTKSTLIKHLQETHQINIEVNFHQFNNYKDFYVWKDGLEKETLTSFAQVRRNIRKGIKRTYYDCHRSGVHRRRGEKRKLKLKGSNRIGGNCPAGIRVDEDVASGKLTVYFTASHFGHDNEVNRLRLDKEARQDLAEKLQQGISKSTLLSSIREHVSPDQRIGLTSKQDLLNISKAFKVSVENIECGHEIETREDTVCDGIIAEVVVGNTEEIRDLVFKEIGEINDYVNKCADFESLYELRQLLAPVREYLDTKFSSLGNSYNDVSVEESSEPCDEMLEEIQISRPINVVVKYNEDVASVQALLTSHAQK